jgi:o-succinylbenzoate synthase
MRLAGARIIPFCAPLRRPIVTAAGRIEAREGFVLELRSDCGERGLGEASPAYWVDRRPLSETHAALSRIVATVEDCRDPDELRALVLNGAAAAELTPAAACALDTALLDLAARSRGIGVSAMLGGASNRAVPVCALLGSGSPENLAKEALAARASGYTVFKLKVGAGTLAGDLANVSALRNATAETDLIRLDANRAWNFEQALSALTAIGPARIEFIEEPMRAVSPAELARLGDATGIAVAVDESISSVRDLESLCESCGSGLVVVLKAARVGGLSKCIELAQLARAAGIRTLVVTDSIESSIGMSATVHLASAIATAGTAIGLGGARFFQSSEFDGVPAIHDAARVAARGPGLAVSVERLGM